MFALGGGYGSCFNIVHIRMTQLTLRSKDTSNSEFHWPTVGINCIAGFFPATIVSVDHGVLRMQHSVSCINSP